MHSGLIRTLFILLLAAASATAQDWKVLADLRGKWKFSIGDEPKRSGKNFDDSRWETITAPAAWEDEGFPGYDGYAWYRKHFRADGAWKGKTLYLHCGVVDDVDDVYLNGRLIGSTGSFPPDYSTAYSVERIYPVPWDDIVPDGDNVIAVRVYDAELSGGILSGRLGVYEDRSALHPEEELMTGWKFKTGDDPSWSREQFDDSRWQSMRVPATWESQGYPGYDGYAWYRLRFTASDLLRDRQLILILGKIDDFDETYLNGTLIGHTGDMRRRAEDIPASDAYSQFRAYTIPAGLLHTDGSNVIAVRVYDGFKDGGIYAGPLGLTTRDTYLRWKNRTQPLRNWFDWLFR
jgi:hypothetical protein